MRQPAFVLLLALVHLGAAQEAPQPSLPATAINEMRAPLGGGAVPFPAPAVHLTGEGCLVADDDPHSGCYLVLSADFTTVVWEVTAAARERGWQLDRESAEKLETGQRYVWQRWYAYLGSEPHAATLSFMEAEEGVHVMILTSP